jgi:hypothetical protein
MSVIEPLPETEAAIQADPPSAMPATRPPATKRSAATGHWIYLSLSLVVFSLALLLSVRGEEQVIVPVAGKPLPGLCGSKMLFGMECPGCGLTRCFINLAHGIGNTAAAGADAIRGQLSEASRHVAGARHNVARAWHYNPGGFILFSVMLAQIPLRSWKLWQVYRGRAAKSLGAIGNWTLWIVVFALVGQWLVRMGLRALG